MIKPVVTKFSSSVPEGEGSVVPLVNPPPCLARPVVPDAAGELTEVPEVSLQADCQGVGRVQDNSLPRQPVEVRCGIARRVPGDVINTFNTVGHSCLEQSSYRGRPPPGG